VVVVVVRVVVDGDREWVEERFRCLEKFLDGCTAAAAAVAVVVVLEVVVVLTLCYYSHLGTSPVILTQLSLPP